MANFYEGEVWFVEFPFEDNPVQSKKRPIVVLYESTQGVLAVKLTTHETRSDDPYDMPILHWKEAQLRMASTARIAKTMFLPPGNFKLKIGDLHSDDLMQVKQLYTDFVKNKTLQKSNHIEEQER